MAGGYNPDDYEELPVNQDVQDLFQYILHYKPEVVQLEAPLKPFIPDYTPAIGDIDEFIKVNLIQPLLTPALLFGVCAQYTAAKDTGISGTQEAQNQMRIVLLFNCVTNAWECIVTNGQ